MGKESGIGPGMMFFMAALGLSGLLLPAAVTLLLYASGLLRAEFFASESSRWAALGWAMFLGGFGICTAPLGLPAVLRLLRVPVAAAVALTQGLASALAGSALLAGLSIYSAAVLLDSWPAQGGDAPGNVMIAAALLAVGIAVRLSLELSRTKSRRGLGRAGLDRDEITCSPGEEITLRLNTEKQAARVEASLQLYDEKEEEPVASYAADVGPAEAGPKGWAYRIKVKVPAGVDMPEEGGWCISVKATGRNGGVYHDSLNVETGGGRFRS